MIRAGAAHAEVMASIHQAAFRQDSWDAPSFASFLTQPGVTGYLDPRGGLLLLRIVADEGEILTVAVIQPRQGIGKALMQAAIALARKAGVVVLYLEVAAGNIAARAFYRSFDFAQTGYRRRYYADGEDAVVLSLRLKPPPVTLFG